jgi:GTP cyclohydrolase I
MRTNRFLDQPLTSCDSVRTLLECIGEDPDREGLRDTPMRYAKAMLYFTKGYEENLKNIVNNAVFEEDHDELGMWGSAHLRPNTADFARSHREGY